MKGRFGIGVDTGGTFTKLIVVTESGRPVREDQIPTDPASGPIDFVRRVVDAVRRLEKSLPKKASGLGLGLPGDLDAENGKLRFSPNLPAFSGYPLRDRLARELGRTVRVENDANMAAWGAYVVELERKATNMAVVALGTGVGGGLVIDKKLFHGSTGSAAEIGHMRVYPGGAPCNCGAHGCLEAYAGSYGIVRTAKKLLRGRPSLMRNLCPDLSKLEPRIVAEAAVKGDAVAREVWEQTGRWLGLGITNLVYAFNPDAVVISGGVSRAGKLLLDPVRRVLKEQPFKTPFKAAEVRIAHTPNMGAIGAGLLGLE